MLKTYSTTKIRIHQLKNKVNKQLKIACWFLRNFTVNRWQRKKKPIARANNVTYLNLNLMTKHYSKRKLSKMRESYLLSFIWIWPEQTSRVKIIKKNNKWNNTSRMLRLASAFFQIRFGSTRKTKKTGNKMMKYLRWW